MEKSHSENKKKLVMKFNDIIHFEYILSDKQK